MEYSHDYNHQPTFIHDLPVDPVDPTQSCYQHDFDQPLGPSLQDPSSLSYPLSSGPQSAQKMSCEVKPRLTKEQHDILEAHYQKQQKPNTSTKKGFAESLNVSLEKVNNWFQNRRAKSKQDAKKQQGAVNIFNVQSVNQLGMTSSDTETSPAFPSPDYLRMLQQYSMEDSVTNGLDAQHFHYSNGANPSIDSSQSMSATQQDFSAVNFLPSGPDDIFNNTQANNRRTLTQEQFDAFVQQDMVANGADSAFLNSDPTALSRMFAELNAPAYKRNDGFSFLMSASAAMPSDDLTIPSTDSEQPVLSFPASSLMQDHALSTTTSDWTDSRSSSVSMQQHDDLSAGVPQSAVTAPAWQPGQSVPVDFDQLNQEFQKVAQARQLAHPQQVSHEQPLAWPADDAFERNENQTSMLTQSLGDFVLQTPQPQQQATFKSPTPVSSLAARRQKQRPAPLGLASLRSQSYSGAAQPASPSHAQQSTLTAGQQLRRIKSSNVINGVAPGRVQKSVAPPQRSPLSWNFTDAMISPQAVRHQSSHSSSAVLAPPTPLSPGEYSRLDQARQTHQQWQSSSGHVSRQASISEIDLEHGVPFAPQASLPHQNFTSPPHTPMYQGQPQAGKQSSGNNVITENTPPQSAPALQQSFPSSVFAPPPPPPPQQPVQQHNPLAPQIPQPQQQMRHAYPIQQQLHHAHGLPHVVPAEQHFPMAASSAQNAPQFTVTTSGPPMEMALQFAQHGMPIVDAQGQIQVAMPSQLQFVQQNMPLGQPTSQAPAVPKGQNTFIMTGPEVQPLHVTAQVPKQPTQASSEFFVHEYTPPQEIKRTATPRKPLDTGPKNYTFANQGPEHFEKSKKGDAKSSTTSNSPASAMSS